VDDAGRCDQFVGRVSAEVQPSRLQAHGEVERPDVEARQRSNDLGIVQVDLDTPQLNELRELPEDDRTDTPTVSGQEPPLAVCDLAGQREDENVGSRLITGVPLHAR